MSHIISDDGQDLVVDPDGTRWVEDFGWKWRVEGTNKPKEWKLYLIDPKGEQWRTVDFYTALFPSDPHIEVTARSMNAAIRKARKKVAECKRRYRSKQTRWP